MDGQTDVHHVPRCPACAASLGHARARTFAVSSVTGLTKASSWFTIVRPQRLERRHGPAVPRVPLSPEALEAVERQLEAFRRKFGREPTDNDPILFDPDADEPVPLGDDKYERMMIEAMAEVGISQGTILAFKRTGRIVTERNKHLLTLEELREWDDAIEEYRRKVDSGKVT